MQTDFPDCQPVTPVTKAFLSNCHVFQHMAVFTPSDFAFPSKGIKAEATPNTEMTLIVDVDIDLLKELHVHGSVNTMKDRRTDLYQLKKLK